MYPVAHAAIAVGSVRVGERLLPGRWLPLDYRFAAFGALLPDLVDKPLRAFVAVGVPDGHTYAHTLLFSLLLISLGVTIRRTAGDSRTLLVGLGTLTHLLVDPVIVYPQTLFWPLFGFEFSGSRGIPSMYLQVIDAVLVVLLLAALRASRALRSRASAFARSGAF
jgi:membrane-bound metal-dependent hydrolase YbcI (DUF457 family)